MEKKKTDTMVIRIGFTNFTNESKEAMRKQIFEDLCFTEIKSDYPGEKPYAINWLELIEQKHEKQN